MEWFLLTLNRVFNIDPIALLACLAGVALIVWARRRVDRTLAAGAAVAIEPPVTGRAVAGEILRAAGLEAVPIVAADGPVADWYDAEPRTLRLSPATLAGSSRAAVGLAAFEAGHALQHAERAGAIVLWARDGLAQLGRVGPRAALLAIVAGFGFDTPPLMHGALFAFAISAALPLAGLPFERDAARRARRALAMTGLIDSPQLDALAPVLDAAGWRTIAAALPRVWRPGGHGRGAGAPPARLTGF